MSDEWPGRIGGFERASAPVDASRWYLGGALAGALAQIDDVDSALCRAVETAIRVCADGAPAIGRPTVRLADGGAECAWPGGLTVRVTRAGWSTARGASLAYGDWGAFGRGLLAAVAASANGGDREQDQARCE